MIGLCAAVAVVLVGAVSSAQAAGAPAERPPDDFAALDYVDSKGCAFRRAQLGDRVIWAERLTADGMPLCGLVPSLAAQSPSDALVAIPPNRRGTEPAFPDPGFYIQVGAFTGRSRADGFVLALQSAGLTVLRQDFPRGGGRLRVLFVGPFAEEVEFQDALGVVKGLGFTDAFVRGSP